MLCWTGTYMPNMSSLEVGLWICQAKPNCSDTSELSVSINCSSLTKKHHCLRLKNSWNKKAREKQLNHQEVCPQLLPLVNCPLTSGSRDAAKLLICGGKDQVLSINKPWWALKFPAPTESWHKWGIWLIELRKSSQLKAGGTLRTPLQSYTASSTGTTPEEASPASTFTTWICFQ